MCDIYLQITKKKKLANARIRVIHQRVIATIEETGRARTCPK